MDVRNMRMTVKLRGGRTRRRDAAIALLAMAVTPITAFAQPVRAPKRIGFLGLGSAQGNAGSVASFRAGMLELGLVEIRQPSDVDPAFKRAATLGAQAWAVTYDGLTSAQNRGIADHMIRLKVPAMYANAAYAEAGGLMSYGASFSDNFRRAAMHVDKIFKGAKPGELPIEQPTHFDMVVNMKTAKAMGVTIRESVMLVVDRVIE